MLRNAARRRAFERPGPDDSDDLGNLLSRSGRGDQSAFAELYDRLAPLLYGVVVKVVRDPSQSEEVTQEAFIELWRLAPRYERVAWVRQVVGGHARPPPGNRPGSLRAGEQRSRRARCTQATNPIERRCRTSGGQHRGNSGAQGARALDRDATASSGAGLLWRTQLPRGRLAPRRCRRNDQDEDS